MLTVLALAPVALVVEFDVEEVDGAVESFQAGEFLGDVDAEVVGNLDVAALDDDLGAGRRFGRRRRLDRPWSIGRSPRNGLDILGNSFLFGVARALRAGLLTKRADRGAVADCRRPPAGARCRILTSYRDWRINLGIRDP